MGIKKAPYIQSLMKLIETQSKEKHPGGVSK